MTSITYCQTFTADIEFFDLDLEIVDWCNTNQVEYDCVQINVKKGPSIHDYRYLIGTKVTFTNAEQEVMFRLLFGDRIRLAPE